MKKWRFLVAAIALEITGSLAVKGAVDVPALYTLVVVGYVRFSSPPFMSLRSGMGLGVGRHRARHGRRAPC